MPLGMLGGVDQKSCKGSGQGLAADLDRHIGRLADNFV
jgi:hypothetical protein